MSSDSARLLEACVAFAATVSPEAVALVIELLDYGDVAKAGGVLTGDAARSFATLVSACGHGANAVSPRRVADILRGAALATATCRQEQQVQLVWSGPCSPSSTLRSTAPALLELICSAKESVYLVTFAAYKVPEVSSALADAVGRGVRVVIVTESDAANGGKVNFDPRPYLTTSHGRDIRVFIWPTANRPKDTQGRHGSLHAKFAVADRRQLLVSSANLTEFAFNLNIELGVLLTGGSAPAEAAAEVDRLIRTGILRQT